MRNLQKSVRISFWQKYAYERTRGMPMPSLWQPVYDPSWISKLFLRLIIWRPKTSVEATGPAEFFNNNCPYRAVVKTPRRTLALPVVKVKGGQGGGLSPLLPFEPPLQ